MPKARRLAFEAFHRLRRDGTPDTWRRFESYQWLDTDSQDEIRRASLRSLLAHAFRYVPYYCGIAEEMRLDPRDVEAFVETFPLLDKTIIRANATDLLSTGVGPRRRAPNATSGSTGETLRFFTDLGSKPHRAAATYRFYRWAGVSPFDRHAMLWGARFDAPAKGTRQRLRQWMHPTLFLSSYRLAEEQMVQYARRLRDFRPRLLTSYPSPLERFAVWCAGEGIRFPGLRAIICSAEQLLPHQRQVIEEALEVPVFDRLGSREFGNLAQECERHEGLHVATDRVWLEIVDEAGRACPPGTVGEIVITDLHNQAMPFLRYRTGDRAVAGKGACPCGRTLLRLERLEGRVFDLIHTPSGKAISGTFWPQIVKQASPDVVAFQVRQTEPGSIRLLLTTETGRELDAAARENLLRRIRDHAPDLTVHIEHVAELPLTPAGKQRQVISEL